MTSWPCKFRLHRFCAISVYFHACACPHHGKAGERKCWAKYQQRIEIRVGGQSVLGPMTLEELALVLKFGGYRPGDDVLADSLAAPGHPRTEILIR